MTLHLSISGETERSLRRHADLLGLPVETVASRLLERFVLRIPDLLEMSGPIYDAFKASGMSEDELSDLLEREKHALRAERRGQTP